MRGNKKTIDLSGTQYDALETDLTQFMGLKVFLVKGWSGAGAFNQAEGTLAFAKTQEAWEQARDNYLEKKKEMLDSLRANIAKRDPALGAELTDNDLHSIQQTGHVTLRKSNTEREHAVIIFDPVSTPPKNVATIAFSDAAGENKQTVNLVTGGAAPAGTPDNDAVIDKMFMHEFQNWWARIIDTEEFPQVKDLVENFDIKMEDIRRYEALMNVRYALRNQDEFVTRNRHSRDNPTFVNFADLGNDNRSMGMPHYKREYRDVLFDAMIEERYEEKGFGIEDDAFFKKMKLAGAVMNLVWSNLTPNNTFARINHNHHTNREQINDIMNDLGRELREKLAEKYEKYDSFSAMQDWRILFPAFREIYEADTSTGAKREYLDTIMEGLQKFFPTITNAPVPAPDRENEPPRKLSTKPPSPKHGAASLPKP